MRTKRTWALVADGAKARIVKNFGHESGPTIVELAGNKQALGSIMADGAGRSYASAGNRRSSMELSSDPVRDNERAFATTISQILDKHVVSGDLDALIVICEHRMLGDLRKTLSPRVKQKITQETDKNLTGMPEKELLESISKLKH